MSKPSWIGATLKGRYKIDILLGQGGMSAVYKATDPNLKRVVAVKLIHAHLSGDQQFVTRFEEEAASVAQLRHPNIVQVYDFDHDEDVYYMVLEFIPGESLNDRLKRLNQSNRHLPVLEALLVLSQVCDAVDYAHKRGLVHRDIKPANIMLNVQNQAILMDFGIVKILGGEKHTATGAVLGTALYMSPEQVRGEMADPRSDIYALGVTLFEMLSGNPPFQADSVMTVLMMHLTDPVPDLRNLRSDVPAEVIAVIEKAMAKDPSQRFQSAAEMAAAMRRILARYQTPASTTQAAALDDATMIEPAGSTLPEPPKLEPLEDATYVERAKPSQPVSHPLGSSAGSRSQPGGGTAGDTGPMPQIRTGSTGQSGTHQAQRSSSPNLNASTGTAMRQSGAHAALNTQASAADSTARRALPWLLLAGGGVGVVAVLAVIIFVVILGLNQNGGSGNTALTAAHASQTAAIALLLEKTPEVAPSLVGDNNTPTPPATATQTPTVTLSPTITNTLPPTETPTPTVPPGIPYVRINKITIDEQNRYVVEYETFEYTEQLPGMHVHFFFNTVPPEQAGLPGKGPWILYGGPRPFKDYTVNDKPAAADEMCALVANANHSVQANSGTCYPLP